MRKTFYLWLFILWVVGCTPLEDKSLRMNTRPVTQWEYHLGDFSVNGDSPQALKQALESASWHSIGQPLNPPNRRRQFWVWYRTPLPSVLPQDHFYLRGVDERFEVYLKGQEIYHFGTLPPENPQYLGFPWHMFPLQSAQKGDYLYFRVYSDYRHIGIFGQPRLGSTEAHLSLILRQDLDRVVVGCLMIFTGMFVLLLFARQTIRGYSLLCLFAFSIGIYIITRTELKQILVYAPITWKWLELICLYTAAPALGLFLNQIFRGRFSRAWDIVLVIQMLFGLSSLLLAALGELSLQDTTQPFLWTLLFSIPLGLTVVLANFRKLGTRAVFSLGGFFFFCCFAVYDVLVSLKLLPWSPPVSHWGLLILLISLVFLVKVQVEKLYHDKRLAEEANLNKTHFLSNFSHEIRTPLNAILGFSKILLKETAHEQETHKKVEIIHHAGTTLLNLINDILDLSKIDANRQEITLQPICLKELLEEVHSLFTLQMKRKNIQWTTEINQDAPGEVLVDAVKLRQIILNLVGNALKFTPQGQIQLIFQARQADGLTDLQIQVRDTGIGISPEEQHKIFQAFYQISANSAREYAGTGLGLSITQRLVQLLGGQLSLESDVGQGSCFSVVFPGLTVTQTEAQSSAKKSTPLEPKHSIQLKPEQQHAIQNILHQLEGNRSIKRIQRLARQLREQEHPELKGYGDHLMEAVQEFDIEEINQILAELQQRLNES